MKIDRHLEAALKTFTTNFRANRAKAFSGFDFEQLRGQLAEARDRALGRNEELLAQFQQNAEKHGTVVLRAKDSAEANQMVLEIMERHGAKKLVKSKSMVSEETRLNHFLEDHGIEARETDLGEWIVQLRAERPTHMVLPAIHLTRKDVAEIFSKKLGRPIPGEIPAMVQIAREELRKEIFDVKVGLTGANALIAETGSMMMVTNEGNGRLCSTIPSVHIVLASIEKVVPSVKDALLMLRLLPKNATGQVITTYVSFISGPHQDSQYLVLLDNHRSELLKDPVFKDVLRCIKCSACLNVCPVYLLLGGAEYSHIYMGGIGTLLTAWINGLKESKDLAGLCLGCHRCEEICAAKIPIADLVIALRERLNRELGKPMAKRIIFDGVFSRPGLHKQGFKLARSARSLIKGKDGFARKMPAGLQDYDRYRSLPGPAEKSFSELFNEKFGSKKAESGKGRVRIYAGCLVENFYPEIGLAAADVLSKLGYQVALVDAGCCGFPAANAGFKDAARPGYEKLLENISGDDLVVTLCPTCTTMLTHAGPELMPSAKSQGLAQRVVPFSRFLIERESENLKKLLASKSGGAIITYHESCHHKHLLKASEASRSLLKIALGTDITEMPDADSCCGFAGTFSLDHPDLSEALLAEKISAVKASGAEVVALDCPGCLLQIRGGCHKQNLPARVMHLAEILAQLF
jgi:iron-sulfur cluster protein